MTETKNSQHEPALPAKRKPDFTSSRDHDHQQQTLPNKSPKLQTLDESVPPNQQNHTLHNESSLPEPVPQNEDTVIEFDEEEEKEKEEEDDDDDYDDDDDDEEENGSAPVDRKGKGIMVEEVNDSDDEDDDDDDDSSDGGDESECESDLSDDPLAEVDLDNILPSRTRRHGPHPGVRIARGSDGSDS